MKIINPDNLRVPTELGATPCLLGNRCRECGTVVFPKMPVCPKCHHNGAMEEIEIGRTGTLYSHTISYFAPKGFKAPAFQAFIDLPEGPRVFSLIGSQYPVERGILDDGMAMRLIVEPLANTPEHREELTYKYVPATESEELMRDVAIIGVGAHATGRFRDKPLKALAYPAIWGAMEDAGVQSSDINVAYVGNSLGGLLTGQEGVRGQVVLQHSGITGIPIVNVENACASAMTALRGAWLEVASGAADVALAVGVEKMDVGDNARTIGALSGVSELDLSEMGMSFTTSYAIHPKINLKSRMEEYGWTAADFAKPAVKNSYNGSLNPLAQHRKRLTIEEVVQSRVIVDPLTLLMCSSISDGAAAAVVCAADIATRFSSKTPIRIASCVLQSGVYRLPHDDRPDSATTSAYAAYEKAGIGPEDLDAIELHDAMAPSELMLYERLGLCGAGEGPKLIDEHVTTLDGRLPVNPSGGLCSRGHPVGATGLLQICELVWQMRGEAGKRQIEKRPKVTMAQNQGGLLLGQDSAVYGCTILKS